ncbi:hypothetical protein GCM10010170_041210 [Dactylosporangium salmoneum]|uniref:Uncharacterized protein n=1 Tax=Dactylosporangium salmoneum TaxID=53361 RepID=A0ABN3GH31_9ACTN
MSPGLRILMLNGGQRDPERPRHPERRRPAHGQPHNGVHQRLDRFQPQVHGLAGQPCLIHDHHRAVNPVNGVNQSRYPYRIRPFGPLS